MTGKPRVLVVEDDVDVLHMVGTMLRGIAEVSFASDGTLAQEVLVRGPVPDLVITDIMMPKMDGLSLAQFMKHDPRFAKIPVLILTARTDPGDVIQGINAGARHYLTKPFKPDDLLAKVKKILNK